MAENIIIKQNYFDNVQTAINSLNEFFTSGFKTKNFPIIDRDFQLEPTVERIISRLDSVDPTWLEDEARLNGIIQTINENLQGINPVDGVYQTIVNSNNKTLIDTIDAYIGFKMLQTIANSFQDFSKFINGIYTFEIFTHPSQFVDVLEIFAKPLSFDEIPDLDIEEKIFDERIYVDGIIKSEQITIPNDMTIDVEVERLINRKDLLDVEVYVDDAVQEAAEVNYFENSKPIHMKYSEKNGKWMISQQFEKTVNDLVAGLRNCDSTDDLNKFFSSDFWNESLDISETVMPYILAKVFSNTKKFPFDTVSVETEKYWDSYKSILEQNGGAKRFQNYDLYSTFKTDKEGTIKFVEDFLKLKLINDEDASIANNTLLTLFNIFDSRIYLDLAYNVAPDSMKSEKTEDQFVKEIRARINKNSRSNNAYKEDDDSTADDDKEVEDSKTVTECVLKELNKFGEMSISDMSYCEQYRNVIYREIETVGDRMYNEGVSPFLVEEYIGESFYEINNHLDGVFQEANIQRRRETLQSAVSSLIADMERIVKLDKQHRWNNNAFVHSYRTSAGLLLMPLSNVVGSSEQHTNIKEVYRHTRRAVKGKSGEYTPEQAKTLNRLNDLVGDLWGTVKLFWTNPINWTKELNIFNNDKIQKRVKQIAEIAKEIVAMKKDLEFLQDDDFVNEAWYDGSSDYIFQEATTEKNYERLGTAINILMNDMKEIDEIYKKKQWTNNACISRFKGESYGNLKEAIKYVNRGIGGSCGKLDDSIVGELKTLLGKLEEMKRTIKLINVNPLIGKTVKESPEVRKVATLAGEIFGMQDSFDFGKPETKSADNNDADETVDESFEYDFKKFSMIMEYGGGRPGYIERRLGTVDDPQTTVTPTPLPDDVPQNDIGELIDSIDTKLDNSSDDDLHGMLGSGFEDNHKNGKDDGKIVVNITNNYNNSFNKDSGNTTTSTYDDHSTGKTTNTTNTNSNNNTNSHNNSSHDNHIDSSNRKSTRGTKGSNNNNNSNGSIDPKDSSTRRKDGEQKLSSGQTLQEMFLFLESKEPQSNGNNAGKLPTQSLTTQLQDKDRESLAGHQEAKRKMQKVANAGKAVFKPVSRVRQWLSKTVQSLIERDEESVKAEMIENASYRSAVYKAMRLALHLGLIGVAFTIQPYLGIAVTAVEGLRLADRPRLRKEAQNQLNAEIEVIEERIDELSGKTDKESLDKKHKLMRMKKDAESLLIQSHKTKVKSHNPKWW